MKLNRRVILTIGVALGAAVMSSRSLSGAEPAPETMVRMVVRLIGPDIKANSFPALPKTIYRGGAHFARIEDPPDSRQQIQKLTIIAEPNAYSVNLIDKKGTHVVDQGGEDDLHLPIVLPFDPKHQLPKLDRLEFGDEFDFFEEAGAKKEAGPSINAKPTDALRLSTPGGTASLVVRGGTRTPVFLTWTTKDGTYKYEYIEYSEKPFDAALFERPSGITYKEIKPDTSGER